MVEYRKVRHMQTIWQPLIEQGGCQLVNDANFVEELKSEVLFAVAAQLCCPIMRVSNAQRGLGSTGAA